VLEFENAKPKVFFLLTSFFLTVGLQEAQIYISRSVCFAKSVVLGKSASVLCLIQYFNEVSKLLQCTDNSIVTQQHGNNCCFPKY